MNTDQTGADLPWGAGVATGVGSMPGTDVREVVRVVVGELPGLVPLPELPARGAGADMIGRALALSTHLPAETVPTGWRITSAAASRPGPDLRRASSWLREDLDALEELAADIPVVKVAVAGPLTVAASVELASGERMLRDHGAVQDIADALAEGVAVHVAELRRRLPRSALVLQLDEPALPAVLAARVPTASGYATLRAVDAALAERLVARVLDAAKSEGATPVVHCCAADVPVDLLVAAGARAVSVDATALTGRDDSWGSAIESGVGVIAGLVPTDGSGRPDPVGTVEPVRQLGHRLGLDPEHLARSVVVAPACGLAGRSWPVARTVLARCVEAARVLRDDPEGTR